MDKCKYNALCIPTTSTIFQKTPYCIISTQKCYQVFIVPVTKYFISSKTNPYGMTAFAIHILGSLSL